MATQPVPNERTTDDDDGHPNPDSDKTSAHRGNQLEEDAGHQGNEDGLFEERMVDEGMGTRGSGRWSGEYCGVVRVNREAGVPVDLWQLDHVFVEPQRRHHRQQYERQQQDRVVRDDLGEVELCDVNPVFLGKLHEDPNPRRDRNDDAWREPVRHIAQPDGLVEDEEELERVGKDQQHGASKRDLKDQHPDEAPIPKQLSDSKCWSDGPISESRHVGDAEVVNVERLVVLLVIPWLGIKGGEDRLICSVDDQRQQDCRQRETEGPKRHQKADDNHYDKDYLNHCLPPPESLGTTHSCFSNHSIGKATLPPGSNGSIIGLIHRLADKETSMAQANTHVTEAGPKRMVQWLLAIAGLTVVLAACGGADTTESAGSADASEPTASTESTDDSADSGSSGTSVSIANDGTTAWEGHTPLGFMGSGVGLFAGDNLNPNFPDGVGLQILLTFALPDGVDAPTTATLSSDVMSTRGNVFEALGELRAAPVSYDGFSAALWNIEPTGDFVTCDRPSETSLTCDVTAAATAAIEAGDSAVQIQLTLEQMSDSDGEQDLVLFNNGDSNLNEPGLFTLELG